MGVISVAWGVLAIIGLVVGFFPCLGWLNWVNIPFAAVGLVISIIAAVKPQSRGAGTIGMFLNGGAVVFGVLRLFMGGGMF